MWKGNRVHYTADRVLFDKCLTVPQDIETVDTSLVRTIDMWMFSGYRVVFGLLAVCIGSPYYIIAMPPFFVIYWYVQRIFVKTTRQLKRIESVSKVSYKLC